MRRLFNSVLLLAVIGGGGYVFLQHFRIDIDIQPRDAASTSGSEAGATSGIQGLFGSLFRGRAKTASAANGVSAPRGSIRIATFNLHALGDAKSQQPIVMDKLADICRRFDVLAIQEVQSTSQDILPRLIERMNALGGRFDYVIGPRLGRGQLEQYAFLFNTATVAVDRAQMYTLNDPDDLLAREPLVASFRALAAQPADAFTFTLVNIRTEPTDLQREMAVLDDVVRLIRAHKPEEDDVILLGDFNVDESNYGELASIAGMTGAIRAMPTNTEGTQSLDNILFVPHATNEFTGRSGVFDFMREFNLSLQHALELSDRMPVWADFHFAEGGVAGHVASGPSDSSSLAR